MRIKKETSLESTANKIGCVILLGHLFHLPVLKFIEKFLNFTALRPNSIARYTALLVSSLFLLKVNPKEMFTRKTRENNFGFKRLLLLTVVFIMFDRFFTFTYIYITGYYKLLNVMPIYCNVQISSNIIIIAIDIFIAVVCEEIIFRGIILENLRKYGDMFSIVAASIIFGIEHGQLIFIKSMTGIILGILYVISGNIKWPIVVHYIFNMGSGLLRRIIALQFPQVTDIQYDLAILVVSFIIMVIFLLLCLKDEMLRYSFHRWSVKNVLNQFKQDKFTYKEFFGAPAVVGSLIIELLIIGDVFGARLDVYFKK